MDNIAALRARVAELEAEVERKREVLKAVEWEGFDFYEDGDKCPVCGNYQYEGHVPGCALKRELEG